MLKQGKTWLVGSVIVCLAGATGWCQGAAVVVIDDFETPKLSGWQASGSPDYYKGGFGAKGLAAVSDAESGSRVLRAHITFKDPNKSEVVWISKSVARFPAMHECRALRFRYKITTNRLDGDRGFILRLRFSERYFADHVFVRARDVVPHRWQTAVIALDKPAKPRNIYNAMFAKPICLTFRLDDDDATPVEFDFCVDDIRLELKEAADAPYIPRLRARERGPLRRALLITHSTASHYFVREALEAIEPKVEIERRLFRGLHFPIFGFPETIDELFAFDCVALVDVDPYVLTRRQVEWLCDYVASGGGLLFVAGPATLGCAKDFKRPLADLLPVTFGKGKGMATINAAARKAAAHAITSGLPAAFDRITKAHPLELKPGARCLVEAPGAQVLAVGDFHRGRVAVLNGHPEVSRTTANCFFTGKGYRELVSRTVRWLGGQPLRAFAGSHGPGYVPAEAPPGPYPALDRSTFYPIMSVIGTGNDAHPLDERGLRERVDDLIDHGFNTAAITGLRQLVRKPWSNRARLLDYAARYAQSRGMAITFEYARMTNIPHHGRPPKPCVLAPDYHQALAAQFRGEIETAKAYPRLISIKILDEPGAGDWMLDRCEHCQAAFRKRFGKPLRKLSEIPPDDIAGRWQLNQFIADYVAAGYMTSRQIVREAKAPFGLLLTYGPNFGMIACSEQYMVDPLGWSRAPDLIDFDNYPYFYPASDNIRMLQSHWCHAVQRAVAQHLGKPAGFYFELDDRNYPVQINPVEASAECAFTAVGQGCHYLNSFINRAFGTGVSSRPERWAHTGRELKKIRAIGPLLLNTRKAPSQLAVYFPHTQWYARGDAIAQLYAFQLLMRAFGECDVAHEQIVRQAGLGPVRALALLQVELVPDDVAETIVKFVKQGGVLLADRIPATNERGQACRLPAEMFKGESQWAIGECRASRRRYGKGTVWTFSTDLNSLFRNAVEKPVPELRDGLLDAMRKLLDAQGLRTHARASDPEFEADLLLGTRQAIVVVINHRPDAASAAVTVRGLGFEPGSVRELPAGAPVRHRVEGDGLDFDVRLPARCGALVGIRAR